jgi:glycosyltransferase involved in cell wall biosynthesis
MIQILLATYNGASYLEAQLDSLLKQTNKKWTLLIHDDGSTDQTLAILLRYQRQYPDLIEILSDELSFGNACDNFTHLLNASTADYVMFCDQDDVWLPQKIEKTFNRMQALELLHIGIPIVVHTDLAVVDETLGSIAPSMFEYQGLSKSINGLLQILANNSVTGCTMIVNRRAIDVSLPILPCAVMHDWWIAANVVKYHGIVEFIDEPLIQYRQHGSNAVGAKKKSIFSIVLRCFTYTSHQYIRHRVWSQAKSIEPKLSQVYFFWKKIHFTIKSLF